MRLVFKQIRPEDQGTWTCLIRDSDHNKRHFKMIVNGKFSKMSEFGLNYCLIDTIKTPETNLILIKVCSKLNVFW